MDLRVKSLMRRTAMFAALLMLTTGSTMAETLDAFLTHHAELLGVRWWHRMQALHAHGEVLDIVPYQASRRLRRGAADPDAGLDPPASQE